jgi:hypothetical protein
MVTKISFFRVHNDEKHLNLTAAEKVGYFGYFPVALEQLATQVVEWQNSNSGLGQGLDQKRALKTQRPFAWEVCWQIYRFSVS